MHDRMYERLAAHADDKVQRSFEPRLLIREFRVSAPDKRLSQDEIDLPEKMKSILKRNAKLDSIEYVPGYATKSGKKIKGYFRKMTER